jgi:hypothetical protein
MKEINILGLLLSFFAVILGGLPFLASYLCFLFCSEEARLKSILIMEIIIIVYLTGYVLYKI